MKLEIEAIVTGIGMLYRNMRTTFEPRVTRCASSKECWWVEGFGHINGPRAVAEAVARSVRCLDKRFSGPRFKSASTI